MFLKASSDTIVESRYCLRSLKRFGVMRKYKGWHCLLSILMGVKMAFDAGFLRFIEWISLRAGHQLMAVKN